jgi:hypothetical protein
VERAYHTHWVSPARSRRQPGVGATGADGLASSEKAGPRSVMRGDRRHQQGSCRRSRLPQCREGRTGRRPGWLIAYLSGLIAGSDTWPRSKRDGLVGTRRTRPEEPFDSQAGCATAYAAQQPAERRAAPTGRACVGAACGRVCCRGGWWGGGRARVSNPAVRADRVARAGGAARSRRTGPRSRRSPRPGPRRRGSALRPAHGRGAGSGSVSRQSPDAEVTRFVAGLPAGSDPLRRGWLRYCSTACAAFGRSSSTVHRYGRPVGGD